MTEQTDPHPGDRLRDFRQRLGLTQEALAERAQLSVGVVKKLERGGQARIETYHALARALRIRTSQLFEPAGPPQDLHADDHAIDLMPLRQAVSPPLSVTGTLLREDGEPPNLPHLAGAARALSAAYARDDYGRVAAVLPELVRSAHVAVLHFDDGPPGEEALRIRADVSQMAGRYLTQVRAYDLAHMALADAVRDAARAGDRMRAALAVSAQGWTLLRQGRLDEAERITLAAAEAVEPRISRAAPAELGIWGRLLRRASSAAARNNRPEEAGEYLTLARTAATALRGKTSEHLYGWNHFNAMRVSLQAIENHMVGGRPERALALTARLPANAASPSTNWRRHRLTVAQAHSRTRAGEESFRILSELKGEAPEWLKHQRLAGDIFREARGQRKRPLTGEQRALGDFLGVP
ncbi:helix-turn-helix transcriptional regulator [Streptomyces sp. DSM 44917]|uniref:Helix-turn-helix transcriptional regulator n=1 Tax=Streptomyces boetiae TaxID=3075541 RepID=A0ABU2L7D1_9ACTN|nr:helix-turn-helix transcriptional regulator [Streptomyces sp. DSM 44917]MDT0307361.1 helix-turn-helix transcriptional regulator [Streptomyces sp. DSM 44917]